MAKGERKTRYKLAILGAVACLLLGAFEANLTLSSGSYRSLLTRAAVILTAGVSLAAYGCIDAVKWQRATAGLVILLSLLQLLSVIQRLF